MCYHPSLHGGQMVAAPQGFAVCCADWCVMFALFGERGVFYLRSLLTLQCSDAIGFRVVATMKAVAQPHTDGVSFQAHENVPCAHWSCVDSLGLNVAAQMGNAHQSWLCI